MHFVSSDAFAVGKLQIEGVSSSGICSAGRNRGWLPADVTPTFASVTSAGTGATGMVTAEAAVAAYELVVTVTAIGFS